MISWGNACLGMGPDPQSHFQSYVSKIYASVSGRRVRFLFFPGQLSVMALFSVFLFPDLNRC